MPAYLPLIFKGTATIFATISILTGVQGVLDPVSFSAGFGLPVTATDAGDKKGSTRTDKTRDARDLALTYTRLMGVRQLFVGIILLIFAYQRKWTEVATILSIMGFTVAGTDGILLWRADKVKGAAFHALPGAGIASIAVAFLCI